LHNSDTSLVQKVRLSLYAKYNEAGCSKLALIWDWYWNEKKWIK